MNLNELKINKLNSQLSDMTNQWQDWTPTLTWSATIPVNVVTKAKYKQIGKTVFFTIKIDATDGTGTSTLAVSLPILPKINSIFPPITFLQVINTTGYSIRYGFVRDNGTNNDIRVYHSTLTAGQPFTFYISGFYEVN